MAPLTQPFARLCILLLLVPAFLSLTTAAPDSVPIYKNSKYSIDDRIADLLPRMTMEDKLGQVMQGDVSNWMNQETYAFNYTGLLANMEYKRGSFYVGFPVPWDVLAENIEKGQKWLLENTTLGIPALVQTEGEPFPTPLLGL